MQSLGDNVAPSPAPPLCVGVCWRAVFSFPVLQALLTVR